VEDVLGAMGEDFVVVGRPVDERGCEMWIREMCWGVSRGEPSPSRRTSAIECHQKDGNDYILTITHPKTSYHQALPHSSSIYYIRRFQRGTRGMGRWVKTSLGNESWTVGM
jgi:hypothetical protein